MPAASARCGAAASHRPHRAFRSSRASMRMQTFDGVPYSHIATLHGTDVLATTVLQTCIRYESRRKACKFCAIGQSLAAGRTIAHKTPQQLAEVARMAVLLDGVKHMVMTTGTPAGDDRGAAVLTDSAFAIRAAVDLPLQGQCEPPEDDRWYARMKAAGIDTLGMHLEVVTPAVRERVMPGKAAVPVERYMQAPSRRRPGVRPRPGQHLHHRGPGRHARGHPAHLRAAAGAAACTPSWCPSCRSAARRWKTTRRPTPAGCAASSSRWAPWWRPACARPTSRPAAASAAPARRCRSTSPEESHELPGELHRRPLRTFRPCEFRVEVGHRRLGAARPSRCAGRCSASSRACSPATTATPIDASAQMIVALACVGGVPDDVVGTVRIHEAEPGLWWGSRLAVHAAFRHHGRIGATLIRLAVAAPMRWAATPSWPTCRARTCRCSSASTGSAGAAACTAGRTSACRPTWRWYPACHDPVSRLRHAAGGAA
jgi:hypothetical protein